MIRPMCLADIPYLVRIDAVSNRPPWTEAMFKKELDLPFSISAVADQDQERIGFGIVWMISDHAQLLELAVSPAKRKQGIGGRLLEYLIRTAREKGCKKMELEYREDNEDAKCLYEKFGFKIVGERKKFYENTGTAVLMGLEL